MRKLIELDEWEQMKRSILKEMHLPDVCDFELDRISFIVDYKQNKDKSIKFTFGSDDVSYEFTVLESKTSGDMEATLLHIRIMKENAEAVELSHGELVTLRIVKEQFIEDGSIRMFYQRKQNSLNDYLYVNDDLVDSLNVLEQEMPKYHVVIESVLEK